MGRWFTQLPFSCRFIYISSHMSRSIRAWAWTCGQAYSWRGVEIWWELEQYWALAGFFNLWNILLRACLWLETENMDGCLIHFLPYRFSPNFHTASRVSMSTRSSYHLRNATATFECSATCMRTFSLSITLKSINPHQPMSSYFSAYHLWCRNLLRS